MDISRSDAERAEDDLRGRGGAIGRCGMGRIGLTMCEGWDISRRDAERAEDEGGSDPVVRIRAVAAGLARSDGRRAR